MKIKLALLEADEGYLERIVSAFSIRYADNVEIYSFTDISSVMSTLEKAQIDVLIANETFVINVEEIPKRCSFAYFVEASDVESVRGQKAVCKFQKVELIYKQILAIYSENSERISRAKADVGSSNVLLFQSVSGGTGASSMAAACALHFAAKQKRVLYLNLEKFGSADTFFSADGQYNMSDVIYALKSRKSNFSLKLESCVRQDLRGVFFYSGARIALDMFELACDEIINLISELSMTGNYDYIVIDIDFIFGRDLMQIYRQANSIIWVGDGSEVSNEKIARAYMALTTLDQGFGVPLKDSVLLLYNKFSNKTSKNIDNINLKSIGGAPRYEHVDTRQVLSLLSQMDLFDKLS